MLIKFTRRQLKEVLAYPETEGVDEPYFILESPRTGENITLLYSGKNGLEFNKTHGFLHKFPGILIYRSLYGQGLLITQKNDEEGEPKEVRIVSLRPGVEIEVPAGYVHTLVNIGKNFLIVVDNVPDYTTDIDFDMVNKKHGLAYYVVDKKGEIGFEKNPHYSFHPQIASY